MKTPLIILSGFIWFGICIGFPIFGALFSFLLFFIVLFSLLENLKPYFKKLIPGKLAYVSYFSFFYLSFCGAIVSSDSSIDSNQVDNQQVAAVQEKIKEKARVNETKPVILPAKTMTIKNDQSTKITKKFASTKPKKVEFTRNNLLDLYKQSIALSSENQYVIGVQYDDSLKTNRTSVNVFLHDSYFYEPKQIRFKLAQTLWGAWVTIVRIKDKDVNVDQCYVQLNDSNGNRVGGSNSFAASMIYVDD